MRNAGIPHYSPAIVKTLLLALIILTTACFAQQEAADFKALEKKAADGDAEAQIALGLAGKDRDEVLSLLVDQLVQSQA